MFPFFLCSGDPFKLPFFDQGTSTKAQHIAYEISLNLSNLLVNVRLDLESGEGNYAWIDEHSRIHFVTTYSTYFAQEIAATPLDKFEVADIAKNKKFLEVDCGGECLLAYRCEFISTQSVMRKRMQFLFWICSLKKVSHRSCENWSIIV